VRGCAGHFDRAPRAAKPHFSGHRHGGGEEFLVLEGSFEEGGERFEPQSWLRLAMGNARYRSRPDIFFARRT